MTFPPPHPLDRNPGPSEGPDPVLPPPFGEAPRISGAFVMYFMMWAGMLFIGGVVQLLWGFVANAIITEVLVMLAPILVLLRKHNLVDSLGLRARVDPNTFLLAFLGMLALAVLMAELAFWTEKIFPMPVEFKELYMEALTARNVPELLTLLLAAAILPGLCEEVAFRGFFQPIMVMRFGPHAGIITTAGLFTIIHMNPWHIVALFMIGLYLGYLYYWTKSLWVPMLAHLANNGTSVLLMYLAPDASLSQMNEPPPRWLVPVCFIVFVACVRWLHRGFVDRQNRTRPDYRLS